MHYIFSFLILLGLCQGWKTYTATDDSFSLHFPHEIESRNETLMTTVGDVPVQTVFCEGKEDDLNHLYLLNYIDYPSETFSKDSTTIINEVLLTGIEEIQMQLGGRLDYSSPLQKQGRPALRYRITYNKGEALCKGMVLLDDNRYFSLQVFTTTDRSLNDDIEIFLSGFRFKNQE